MAAPPNFSRWLALLVPCKGLARADFGLRHQRPELRVGRQQFIHQGVVLLGLQRLNCQEPLIRHLDYHRLTRLRTLIQRLFQIRFQEA